MTSLRHRVRLSTTGAAVGFALLLPVFAGRVLAQNPPGPPPGTVLPQAAPPEAEPPATTPSTPPKGTKGPRPNSAVPLSVEALSQKVARYPDNPYLLNELGNLLLRQGRRQDARAKFEQAVHIDKDYAAAWNNLGVARFAMNEKSEAKTAYRKAVAIQPNFALAWYNLAVVLDAQDYYEDAIKAYERAFVLDPALLDVRRNPQVASNRRIPAVMTQTYIDRGGSVAFPTESSLSQTR
jgi:tetratricopeptide (TPR) repeat protein